MTMRTVLVVEDQEGLADLYEVWLEQEYDVRTAYNTRQAKEALDEEIDVALLDRRLPDGSGDDVLAMIRDQDIDAKVAMITAVDPEVDILEMGFDDYVVKPISEGDLHDLVEGLLARARYSMEIQRYAALAAKRATLESQMSPDELDASEGYAELLGELATLRANIDERANDFEEDDYEALFHDI